MASRTLAFELVEKHIRKKDFGILGTVSNSRPHSTGILYAVSPPNQRFLLYIVTGMNYKKAKNIIENPNVSFVIPFPHHILRFVPAPCIQFQAVAEIIETYDREVRLCFQKNRILRMTLKQADALDDMVFLKIKPDRKIYGHGIGMSIFELRKDETKGSFTSLIPEDRL
ncbi:MAG: pyridoxamine 5'-phosphate oxidase family protein [Candidatus Kariarchaeaceae archaeon]|jgi:hypothetical protein